MLAQIYLLVLPLTALATAIGMVIATLAKGYKEAQTMLSLVTLLPIVPGLMLTLVPFKAQAWMMLLPVLSEQILIDKLIRGDAVAPLFVLLCCTATLVFAALALLVAIRLYGNERVFARR